MANPITSPSIFISKLYLEGIHSSFHPLSQLLSNSASLPTWKSSITVSCFYFNTVQVFSTKQLEQFLPLCFLPSIFLSFLSSLPFPLFFLSLFIHLPNHITSPILLIALTLKENLSKGVSLPAICGPWYESHFMSFFPTLYFSSCIGWETIDPLASPQHTFDLKDTSYGIILCLSF